MKECNFETLFKEDFIYSISNYLECELEIALELWYEHGEEYMDNVFQAMSDEVIEITNKVG